MTDGQGNGVSAETAYQRLRDEIVRGTRMPNERLVESDLIAQLGVSRAVVRSLLARLEQDGLVVRERNRGARVRLVSETEAIEILQARSVLEALAARQAAVNATDGDIALLQSLLTRMNKLIDDGDFLAYSETNAALHSRIIQASRHQTAARLIADLRAQTVRFQYRTILVPGRPRDSFAEHSEIVAAIAAHDADAAESAMRRHLGHVATTLTQTATARSQHSNEQTEVNL